MALGDTESITGEIPVSVKRGIGFEKLRLYVTNMRIIVSHGSRKGRGALALRPLLGRYSGDLEEPSESKDKRVVKEKLGSLSPGEILSSHKDNFALRYDELVSLEIVEKDDSTSISLVTGDDKFQFFTKLPVGEVSSLLSEYRHS